MVFSANNLWRHVARSPACVLMVFLPKLPGDAHIGNSQIAFRIKDHVFRFHVPMDNIFFMEILKPDDHVGHKKSGLILSKTTALPYMVP